MSSPVGAIVSRKPPLVASVEVHDSGRYTLTHWKIMEVEIVPWKIELSFLNKVIFHFHVGESEYT